MLEMRVSLSSLALLNSQKEYPQCILIVSPESDRLLFPTVLPDGGLDFFILFPHYILKGRTERSQMSDILRSLDELA